MNHSSPDWAGMLITGTVLLGASAIVWWSLRHQRSPFTPARTTREAARLYQRARAQASDWGRPLSGAERMRWEDIRNRLISGRQPQADPQRQGWR